MDGSNLYVVVQSMNRTFHSSCRLAKKQEEKETVEIVYIKTQERKPISIQIVTRNCLNFTDSLFLCKQMIEKVSMN